MQTWMCKHDLALVVTDFFNDFDRFSDSQDFDRLSCLKVIF